MRIDRVELVNFQGVRRLVVEDVGAESLLLVSGSNGTGKSMLLEAIYLATSGRPYGYPPELVGPWGATCRVSVTFILDSAEQSALTVARNRLLPHETTQGNAPERITVGFEYGRDGASHNDHPWGQVLLNDGPLVRLPFAHIDYLPADRHFPRGETAHLSPDVLGDYWEAQVRQNTHNAATNRAPLTLSGIKPVLATLDYLDLLQQRSSGTGSTGQEFEVLAESFERATGKRIPRPIPDPEGPTGSRLVVEIPSGEMHDIDRLSSGEQAVLGMMFYVRRLTAAGGVLLIDEPELHLHAALHTLLFEALDAVADRAQVWAVSHSTRLVTSAPQGALVHVRAPTTDDANQAQRVADDARRFDLLSDLGIDAGEALRADLLLIVEGTTDRDLLRRLLPIETGRSKFVVAGDAASVLRVSAALGRGFEGNWIAIRDRDLLTRDEVQELETTDAHMFVWFHRELENELLHDRLLAAALNSAGRPINAAAARAMVDAQFDRQRPQIEAALIEHRLRAAHTITSPGGQSRAQLEAYLRSTEEVARRKLADLDATAAAVSEELDQASEDERLRLVDGKRALGELVRETPFSSRANLVDALVQTSRGRPSVRSPGIERLRLAIVEAAIKTGAPSTQSHAG